MSRRAILTVSVFQPTRRTSKGAVWATSFALKELTSAEEATIVALVKKAVG
jgi:hypothetical protein